MEHNEEILVGVDGGEGGSAAIRYAAEQADRWGTGLRLVHVIPDVPPFTSLYALSYEVMTAEKRRVGADILAASEKEAEAAVGPDRVRTALLSGPTAATLVRAAASARLVVLGDQPRPFLKRIATGSVVGGVAAHAPVPVVAVPGNWGAVDGHGRVVAAVKDLTDSADLVTRALEAAADRNAELVIMHNWLVSGAYEDLAVVSTEWQDESRRELQLLLDRVRDRAPERLAAVKTSIELHHDQPAHAIVDSTVSADLVLIGRRRHYFPGGYLGGTGRAVLRASHCPVEVLPPSVDAVELDEVSA